MSLLFLDGFQHYATADIPYKYEESNGSPMIVSSPTGRFETQCLWINNRSAGLPYHVTKYVTVGGSTFTVICGVAYMPEGVADTFLGGITCEGIFEINDSNGNEQATLAVNDDGSLSVYRGDYGSWTQVGTSTEKGLLIPMKWNYIEWKIKIDNTSGEFQIRLNGVLIHSGENLDTQAQTTSEIGQVQLRGFAGTIWGDSWYGDFYICDTAGGKNNDFLGDIRVRTLWPDGAGNYSQWVPSGEASNYLCVDDATAIDEGTTAVGSSVSGAKDTYSMDALSGLGTVIYGVQVSACASGEQFRALYRAASTDYSGEAKTNEAASWNIDPQVWNDNPADDAAWEDEDILGGEFGVIAV